MQCPGTADGVKFHAKASFLATAQTSCSAVQNEIHARVRGENGWTDPHNQGTYTRISDDHDTMKLKRLTGDGKYTDVMMFTFSSSHNGHSCSFAACSESQVNSFLDFSTDYCNLHNLHCGEQDGCSVAVRDIGKYKERPQGFSNGAGRKRAKCAMTKELVL
eukprot:TRINITY_DN3355_c0_g2_i1.p1 TRINITY_DN3355_c0_g2~~TRINITY_DN3355_c0_g2_i1.p1  ORF type:complete len:161 (+),score=17.01 TRINITY_DN3355_c0_g2_i1:149-631(+)